ncbi:MAG: hypothetical protein WBY44_37355 [Bryobacteraceae bacterium]
MKRAFLLVAVLAAACLGAFVWRARPKPPYVYGFDGRALATPSVFRRIWPEPIPPEVQGNHRAFTDQALIVRDVRVVANDSDFTSQSLDKWGFAGVIRRAFLVGGSPQTVTEAVQAAQVKDALGGELYAAKAIFNPAWNGNQFGNAPVHLLAIVNRLDQARVDGNGNLCGAEIRFDYQALTGNVRPDYLRLIVEFALRCVKPEFFQGWAQSWNGLAGLPMDPDEHGKYPYQDELKTLLQQLTAQANVARLRANGLGQNNDWEMREFVFGAGSIAPFDMEREPNILLGKCQDANSQLGKFAVAHKADILDPNNTWDYHADPVLRCFHDPARPNNCDPETVGANGTRVLVLGADVLDDNSRDEVRHQLSVNSCSACHGLETRDDIHQIGPRNTENTDESDLSGFLTGAADCARGPKATLNTDDSACTAPLRDLPKPGGACADVELANRSYNDLLRRHMFIYKVLHELRPKDPPDKWKNKLKMYMALEVH